MSYRPADVDTMTYRACLRLLGAVLKRWMRDIRDGDSQDLIPLTDLAEWLDLPLDDVRQKVDAMTVETRGRRPASRPRE